MNTLYATHKYTMQLDLEGGRKTSSIFIVIYLNYFIICIPFCSLFRSHLKNHLLFNSSNTFISFLPTQFDSKNMYPNKLKVTITMHEWKWKKNSKLISVHNRQLTWQNQAKYYEEKKTFVRWWYSLLFLSVLGHFYCIQYTVYSMPVYRNIVKINTANNHHNLIFNIHSQYKCKVHQFLSCSQSFQRLIFYLMF